MSINFRCAVARLFASFLSVTAPILGSTFAVQAQDANAFHELETKYIFGNFTVGSSTGIEGEKAFEPETQADFGKGAGHYAAGQTTPEYEFTPTQYLQIILGPTVSYYHIVVTIKAHRFQPAEIRAPANRRLAITVKNLDTAAMEFESVSLRVEKVIAPNAAGVVNVRALAPGRYEFFDDFHQEARGVLVVE